MGFCTRVDHYGSSTNTGIHERSDSFPIRYATHSGDVVGCCWALVLQERDIRVHRNRQGLCIGEIEASEDGVNVGLLG